MIAVEERGSAGAQVALRHIGNHGEIFWTELLLLLIVKEILPKCTLVFVLIGDWTVHR